MTFAAILLDCYRRLGYSTTPTAEVVTRIKAEVNESHEEILSNPALRALLYGSMTLDSVASRARYGISTEAQVRSMTDTANQQPLRVRDLAWYRSRNPSPSTMTGTPEWYIPLGIVATHNVPAATGTGLWVNSSSAADTGGPTVTIDAIRVGGYPHNPSAVSLSGTTRVQVGALTDYIDATQFALSVACAGDISLFDTASIGNAIATIPRGITTSRYWGFLLCLTPSGALTYTIDVEHEIQPLVNDTDEPLLPPRFHRLLAMGARMKEYEKTSDPRYGVAEQQYNDGVNDLVYQIACPPDLTIIPGGGRNRIGSNLGAWFPEGRW